MIKIIKIPIYILRFSRDFLFCLTKLGFYKSTWRFHSLPLVQIFKNSKVEIGNNFVACSNPINNTIGVAQKVMIKTTSNNAKLSIGNNVGVSGCTISCGESIRIGNNVLIGSGVLITDNDAHPIDYRYRSDSAKVKHGEIIIEDDVFIGARAIILKGVRIGFGSVIGAGSVVATDVEEYSIFAGNPAKKIGDIRDESHRYPC